MTRIRGGTKAAARAGAKDKAPGDGSDAARGAAKDVAQGGQQTAQAAAVDSDDAVVRRTKDGWRVGSDDLPDLTSAMVLADLLAAELRASDARQPLPSVEGAAETSAQPKEPATAETSKLRATIGQLEHALMARVRVEQAIGVLAERHRIQPRQAFEQLREAARSRGRRVIDIATDVVASATNPLLQLPDELSRPRAANRHGRRASGVLGSE
jgi:hypothetical protein